MKGLAGKVVIVTGGAAGLGRAAVERFAAAGAKVSCWDVGAEAGAALAKELGAAGHEVEFRADRKEKEYQEEIA